MKHSITALFFMAMLILFGNTSMYSQQRMDKYQLAMTYEEQGDFRNAARIFQELYAESPGQFKYFQGVARSLTALQRYIELMPLIEVELAKKSSIELLSLASQNAKKSNLLPKSQQYFDQAIELLSKLSNDFEKDNSIRLIAQTQSDISSFENAIQTYLKGRVLLNNAKDAYADELSMLYVQIGNVELGIKEIAKVFKKQQQYGLIQGRIAALLIDEKSKSYIDSELSSMSANDYAFSRIYVWFLREIKDFDKALEQALRIDSGLGLQGREILDFADITLRDGHIEISLKAYGNVIDRGKNNPHFSQALYGYAKALEQRLQMTGVKKNISTTEIEGIINRYRDIIAQSPKGQFAAECLYRIGILQSEYLKDISTAKKTFQEVFDKYKQYPISAAATNEIVNIAIASNDIHEAFAIASNTFKAYVNTNPKESDRAGFTLAELYFYTGEIDSCKGVLVGLAGKTDSDIANDALELSLFLEQHKQFTAGLILWGKASLKEKQSKQEDAIELYEEIVTKTSGTDLAEQAQIKICEAYNGLDKDRALKESQKFIASYPESINTDRILFLIAEIHIAKAQTNDALSALTDILVRFPNSRFIRKSRELIRTLRGDS
jgi:outer membrane protein assembly factor BamD (BamD/ComL family)